jgi:hypothetical protein
MRRLDAVAVSRRRHRRRQLPAELPLHRGAVLLRPPEDPGEVAIRRTTLRRQLRQSALVRPALSRLVRTALLRIDERDARCDSKEDASAECSSTRKRRRVAVRAVSPDVRHEKTAGSLRARSAPERLSQNTPPTRTPTVTAPRTPSHRDDHRRSRDPPGGSAAQTDFPRVNARSRLNLNPRTDRLFGQALSLGAAARPGRAVDGS